MNDIKNTLKSSININIFRTLASIATIIASIIGYKKSKSNSSKVINIICGIIGTTGLALEVEKDFKPLDDYEE